jgi:hypothetical protein
MAGFAGHFCSLSTGENVLDPIARNGERSGEGAKR